TAIALRRQDEGGRTFDAEEGDLLLEVVRHVLRSMVMPHGQTAGDRLAEPAEALPSRPARARRSPGLPRATAEAPLQSCAVGTSCHRGRAPLRQTLAVAPRHPAALQRRSLDCPWHTPRAEIVRLRGVPINRDAEEGAVPSTCRGTAPP